MANRIQLRRDTAANWTRVNPILEDGEPGLEIDTNQIKYGDGNSAWNDLAYAGGSGSGDRLTKDSYSVILDSAGHLLLPNDGSDLSVIVTDNFQILVGGGSKAFSFSSDGRITLPIGWEIDDHNGSPIFSPVATTGSYNDLTDKPLSLINETLNTGNALSTTTQLHFLAGNTTSPQAYTLGAGITGQIMYFVPVHGSTDNLAGSVTITLPVSGCNGGNYQYLGTRTWNPFNPSGYVYVNGNAFGVPTPCAIFDGIGWVVSGGTLA